MLRTVEIVDFKGHRQTRLEFGKFTVLVGDNASGKTSVLEALALFAALNPNPVPVLVGDRQPIDLLRRGVPTRIALSAQGTREGRPWTTAVTMASPTDPSTDGASWHLWLEAGSPSGVIARTTLHRDGGGGSEGAWTQIGATLGTARLYPLRADRIAAAAYSDDPDAPVGSDGVNTAVALAAMKLGDDESFARVESALRQLIPAVERVRIKPETVAHGHGSVLGHKLHFDFRGATSIPAHGASHGTLIVLALLTVLHSSNRPNLILLDDFDHALHPRAQMELVRMIKALLAREEFQDVQVVATTHSPYVLDELEPSEIHVFALRDDGTVATKPLTEHPDAAKLSGTLTAGQLWSLDPERDWVLRG